MNFDFLLIFFVARYLRTSLKTEQQDADWDNKLKLAMFASMGLLIVSVFFDESETIMNWIGHLALLGCIYVLYNQPFFKPAKSIVIALVPYAITAILVNFIKLISPDYYRKWHSIINSINLFAVLWGVGVWIVTVKQKKELDIAKGRVAEQEKDNQVITAMKAELEVQVAERTSELTKQKEELETALNELKSTQAQLIQSEKMASLGELTAGIAHEIQNPLNFVNNFSEVNTELIDELLHELDASNPEEIKAVANDIKENNYRIIQHGKRADAIVKGMLQHSRKNTGQKEPTDINALADEYLRLSYHGLRAKDKSFNADFKMDFDNSIGKVNIVTQDVGRVLLNLINNAFYAVNEKKKSSNQNYHPTVLLTTKNLQDTIEIKVKDNGNGIPKNIIDKIFQPFFTTKPTGQGTGLGLSLSYDIITKAHGGIIKAETKEGEGTEFIITLPS